MAIQKQTALNIAKTGNVLTMTWKLADYYDSQETYWSIDGRNVVIHVFTHADSLGALASK